MSPVQHAETIKLQQQMHGYLNDLKSAGFEPSVIAAATLVAISERLLLDSTATQAAAVLRGHALLIEKHGPEILTELRSNA